jgi:hypothetical protein
MMRSQDFSLLDRRSFLMTVAAAATLRAQTPPKRIAAIMTVYRPNSHSDVIVGRLKAGMRATRIAEIDGTHGTIPTAAHGAVNATSPLRPMRS